MRMTARVLVSVMATLVMLAGCGSRGDLYFPDPVHPENTPLKAPKNNPSSNTIK